MNWKPLFCLMLSFGLCLSRNPFPDQTDNNFLNQCLSVTNNYRSRHQAPAIRIDSELVSYAKSRCNLVSRQEGLSHGHAGLKSGVGENLFWGGHSSKSSYSCSSAIKSWYDEVKKYNYNNPGFSMSTGHFTQLIWKSSTNLGCARCGGKGGKWWETYVVCNYSPPGNYRGQYRNNVLKSG